MMRRITTLLCIVGWAAFAAAFSPVVPGLPTGRSTHVGTTKTASTSTSTTQLYMAELDKQKSTKKGVQTIIKDRTESQAEENKDKEKLWRVVLHNDEVHTFNYVIRSLTKVVGTLDRKASFEICVQTHGVGKAVVTKTWKKQAEQFCLGLQRQGLTASIAPDQDFDGGHAGGGNGAT